MSKPVHAFFSAMRKRQPNSDAVVIGNDDDDDRPRQVKPAVRRRSAPSDSNNGNDDDDDDDHEFVDEPDQGEKKSTAVPAKTRRKLAPASEPRKATSGKAKEADAPVQPKGFFFKTPAERAALKQAERLQKLDQAVAHSRATTQAILGDRPLHPLFESVALRAKAQLAASGDALPPAGDAAAAVVGVPLPTTMPDPHSGVPSAAELNALIDPAALSRWPLRAVVDADGSAPSGAWPLPAVVATAAPGEVTGLRIVPTACEAERVSELDADLMTCVTKLPSPLFESGAPVEHPVYKALQRWSSDASAPIPTIKELESLFALASERPPLARWLRRALEAATQANPGTALPWTDKYRPMMGTDVAANVDEARLLSHWLAAWKSPSLLDDVTFPDSMLTETERLFPAVLLVGPTGALKSATAYACAARHQYNVLEVNPSAVRTGRLIMQMFGEATLSHNLSAVDGDEAHSMILFEEIDVHNADDRGFFAAVKQLLEQTKRPIVLTCNELTHAVSELLQQSQKIRVMHLRRPELTHAIVRCAFVAFAERRAVSIKALTQLALAHDCDLRRMLLDLQFWCATAARATRGTFDGVFGLAHLNERYGGLDYAVQRLAAGAPVAPLDALALDLLPLDAVHRVACEYAADAGADTLDALAAAVDQLSLCVGGEQRVREACALFDVHDVHMPEAFDTRSTRRWTHASVDEDERWLAFPLGDSASVVSTVFYPDAGDDDEAAAAAASGGDDDSCRAPFSRPVCDVAAGGGAALAQLHRWASSAALACLRRTHGGGGGDDERVASVSALRTSQLSRMRGGSELREQWARVGALLARRQASGEARAWQLHYGALIAALADARRAEEAHTKRRAQPHYMASYLEQTEIHALNRLNHYDV